LIAGAAVWGKTDLVAESTDEYAVVLNRPIAEPLNALMDAVLIVDAGEKSVSSSLGHALVNKNDYAQTRFATAETNLGKLIDAMCKGNVRSFISIVESEALQLHAMMMLSSPAFILMRPNTLAVIEKIWQYREKTGAPLAFTLDAGANVHLLFPKLYNNQIVDFIDRELVAYCQNGQYLCSHTGTGPVEII
jgi:diphosphomevalonate decarboxylase